MSKIRRTQRLTTAHHEAGHDVAARHTGRTFRHVTIRPADDSLGHVLYRRFSRGFRPDVNHSPRVVATIERQVLIGLAGMATERKFRGRQRHSKRRP